MLVYLQVLRVLVLLDECEAAARQEGRKRPTPGHVVAEVLVSLACTLPADLHLALMLSCHKQQGHHLPEGCVLI